jgi:hypothetical protein
VTVAQCADPPGPAGREAIDQLRSDKEQLQSEVSALQMQLELNQAQVQQLTAAPSGGQPLSGGAVGAIHRLSLLHFNLLAQLACLSSELGCVTCVLCKANWC